MTLRAPAARKMGKHFQFTRSANAGEKAPPPPPPPPPRHHRDYAQLTFRSCGSPRSHSMSEGMFRPMLVML